jgi:hypothetical protein
MTAIVTSKFRTVNAENFKEDIGANSVYVAIGKPDVWSLTTSDTTDTTPFTPNDHSDDIGEARANFMAMQKISSTDITHVIPRYTWDGATAYVAWDSNDGSINDKKYYVITSEFKVYKCIIAGTSTSTIQPTQTLTVPTAESDGYSWKYMYTLTVADSEKFLTTSYLPVKTVSLGGQGTVLGAVSSSTTVILSEINSKIHTGMTVSGTGISGTPTVTAIAGSVLTLSAAQSISNAVILTFAYANDAAAELALSEGDYAQYLNQKASRDHANAAGIERIEVSAGGTYSSTPTVTITGDGTGATGTAVMSGSGSNQAVASVTVTNKGTDYSYADISFNSGSASANATIAPPLGHGVDPVSELGGFFVGINTQLSGAGGAGADLTVGNDFRQISLIKNPTNFGTTTISTAGTLKAMNYLDFTSGVTVANYSVDELLVGGTSGAQAYVVQIDSSNGYIYYTQNSKTGYTDFSNGETVTGQTSTTAGVLESSSAVGDPEVNRGSGEILFLENRNPINRSTTQIEDIKVIIEF